MDMRELMNTEEHESRPMRDLRISSLCNQACGALWDWGDFLLATGRVTTINNDNMVKSNTNGNVGIREECEIDELKMESR